MITHKSDQLTFSFPEIGERLHRLVEHHIRTTLPQILAEDREWAIAALQNWWLYAHADVKDRKAAKNKILEATPAEIESALREKSLRCAGLGGAGEMATVGVEFQRTLRIPDDGRIYPLPAGLGRFPLRHVDDFAPSASESWLKRGGVMMPMHQSEALWIYFNARYPFAVKVAAGKINAVTGENWTPGLQREPQNYLALPQQPWLDGFAVRKGIIRQFVAMPLGDGYSVEEQVTGKADVGGVQIQVFPMKADAYFCKQLADQLPARLEDLFDELAGAWLAKRSVTLCSSPESITMCMGADMGLGAGGTMRQEIYEDPNDFADWDASTSSRCFVHLCNSLVWRQITGANPPHPALTATEYARARIPWFDYYRDDLQAVKGSPILGAVKSVFALGKKKAAAPLPDNTTIKTELIVQYGNTRRPDEVREWEDEKMTKPE